LTFQSLGTRPRETPAAIAQRWPPRIGEIPQPCGGRRLRRPLAPGLPTDRAPFTWFWRSLPGDNDVARSENLNAALNAIRQAVGG
jgi:hypothetical protein